MAWAARRTTARDEDGAYCLLGLFEVFMPFIYGEGRNGAFSRLREEIAKSSKAHAPASKLASTLWNVPFLRNRHFVGQEEYLKKLEGLLSDEQPPSEIAITGLGGVGKTQIAIEFAYLMRARSSACSIFWLTATSSESLQQGFADIAQLLQVYHPEQEKNDTKKAVQHALNLERTGRWLIILDNVDNKDLWDSELKGFLPRSQHGCIVCTPRSRKVAVEIAASHVIEMSSMGEQMGMKLLSKLLIRQELLDAKQDAHDLLTRLTFQPLAMTQAAAYINKNGITLSEYVSLLSEQEEDVIELLSEDFNDMGRYDSAKNPVATTWLLSFEQMRIQDRLAAEYLSFMACVDTKAIPRTLLPPAKSPKLQVDALGMLDAYYFVTRRTTDNTFDVHRLVHLAMRNWLRREGTLTQCTINALERLEEIIPKDEDGIYTTRSIWRPYLPHARSLLDAQVEEDFEAKRGILLKAFADSLFSDGRYNEAASSYLEFSKLKQRLLGEEHLDTLFSKGRLLSAYLRQGRFEEAERLGLSVSEMSQRVLGDEHEKTLRIKAIVADVYTRSNRWKDAEKLASEVLTSRRRLFGEGSSATADSMATMAEIYRHEKRWMEAEELGTQATKTYQGLYGNEHPKTMIRMNDLALTYHLSGNLSKAEEIYTQVIQIQKRVLGENQPDTLSSQVNLAGTYRRQERWEEAEEIYEQVIKASVTVLGERNYRTIEAKALLHRMYREQG